jgi:hypothetical protein
MLFINSCKGTKKQRFYLIATGKNDKRDMNKISAFSGSETVCKASQYYKILRRVKVPLVVSFIGNIICLHPE